MTRIGIVSGPTGGHIIPAFLLADELSKHSFDPIIWSTLDEKHPLLEKRTSRYKSLEMYPWSGIGVGGRLKSLYSCFRSYYSEHKLVSEQSCIISFGGFPSVPILFLAQTEGIPFFLHEQNRVMGRANRLFAKYSQKVFLGFPLRDKLSKRTHLVGNPVRQTRQALLDDWFSDASVLLVVGGSQGSRKLSRQLSKIAGCLFSSGWKIIYIRGEFGENLEETLAPPEKKFRQFEFRRDLPDLIDRSDCIWSRAGAGTLSEIIRYQTPAVLFPFQYSSDDHQYWNANWVASKGPAFVVKNSKVTEDSKEEIVDFMKNIINEDRNYTVPWETKNKYSEKTMTNEIAKVISP